MRKRDEMGGFLESEYENVNDDLLDRCDECGMVIDLKDALCTKDGAFCQFCANERGEDE